MDVENRVINKGNNRLMVLGKGRSDITRVYEFESTEALLAGDINRAKTIYEGKFKTVAESILMGQEKKPLANKITLTLDDEMNELFKALADEYTGGNRSAMLAKLVKEYKPTTPEE